MPLAVDPRYKTRWCKRMLNSGFCCFGDACLFIHADDILKMEAVKMQWMSLNDGTQWNGGKALPGPGNVSTNLGHLNEEVKVG